ncbi:hypothetical protein [Nocardia africana]
MSDPLGTLFLLPREGLQVKARHNFADQSRRYIAQHLRKHGLAYGTDGHTREELELQLDVVQRLVSSLHEAMEEAPDPQVWCDGISLPAVMVLAHLHQYRREVLLAIDRLADSAQIREIKQAVEQKVSDPQVQQELSDLLSEIQKRRDELDAELNAEASAEAREIRKIELAKRRWEVRKSMLEREPAAVLIGGTLLGLLTLALIVAMFVHTPVPEVLTSMVLLILGFFFGQTTSGKGTPDDPT